MNDHEVTVHGVMGAGFLAKCSTCGWRAGKWRKESQFAQEDGDKHVYQARTLRLNNGPRPSAKTAIRIYRENAESETYTPAERDMWRQLAIELETELAARTKGPLEGQLPLF